MLDWIVERLWAAVTFVPALFVAEESPNFMLIRAMFGLMYEARGIGLRAMFGLLLIVLIVYVIAMQPFRSAIVRCMRAVSNLIVRRP